MDGVYKNSLCWYVAIIGSRAYLGSDHIGFQYDQGPFRGVHPSRKVSQQIFPIFSPSLPLYFALPFPG